MRTPPLKNDLLMRAIRREVTERTPVWLMRQAGRADPQYRAIRARLNMPLEQMFRTPDVACEISLLPRRIGVDAIIFYQDILTPLAPMGAAFVFRPGPLLDSPLRSLGDVAALRRYDPASELSFVPSTLRQVRQELDGALPLLGFAGAPLTLAFFLIEGRSPGEEPTHARAMMRDQPRLLHGLLEKLADMTVDYLALQIEAGADAVQLFESIADLLTPEQYREFAHPYHVMIFTRLARRAPTILFAKDRSRPTSSAVAARALARPTTDNRLELMAASGADVLSVGSGVDLAEARRRWGQTVALQGNVSNRLLVEGSPEQIDEAVKQCVRAGAHRGHILNLDHGLLKDTPFENVCRFIETCKSISSRDSRRTRRSGAPPPADSEVRRHPSGGLGGPALPARNSRP